MPSIGEIALAFAPSTLGFLIGLIVSLTGYIVYNFGKQRKLSNMLGVDKKSMKTVIYLSSLLVPGGHAVGFDGQPRSYEGIAIPTGELNVSSRLGKALAIEPFEYLPPILRKNLEKRFQFFRPLKVRIDASPMKDGDIDFSTHSIITAGSQGYNIVTNYCTSRNLVQLCITHNGTAIEITKGKDKGEVIHPASKWHDIAILEKLIDHTQNDTVLIIAAGLGVLGTMGAVQYLIDQWSELYKRYGNQEFALVLQFGGTGNRTLEDALHGSIIRSIPA